MNRDIGRKLEELKRVTERLGKEKGSTSEYQGEICTFHTL